MGLKIDFRTTTYAPPIENIEVEAGFFRLEIKQKSITLNEVVIRNIWFLRFIV